MVLDGCVDIFFTRLYDKAFVEYFSAEEDGIAHALAHGEWKFCIEFFTCNFYGAKNKKSFLYLTCAALYFFGSELGKSHLFSGESGMFVIEKNVKR